MLIILLFLSLTIICLLLSKHSTVAEVLLLGFVILTTLLIMCYFASYNNAKYINAKYNTNYTAEDMFWNDKYIEKELKIDKKSLDN